MHTWDVCQTCNSKFGSNVDPLLTDHYFMQWERYIHQLKGESGKTIPNPLEGTRFAEDGEKYKITMDSGVLTPHVVQKFQMSDDGRSVTLSIDPKDVGKANEMMKKYCSRKGLPFDPKSIIQSPVHQSPSPTFQIQTAIDISHFRMGILKIAYEFTACLIPDYLSDAESKRIASILYDADLNRLDEVQFGNAFAEDVLPKIFGEVIDFTNIKRHYLFLTNIEGKMYCFVKLFNTFCIGIKLSEREYELAGQQIIVINDFGKSTFDLYTLEELITLSQQFENVGATFSDLWNKRIQELSSVTTVGFYYDGTGHNLCYDINHNLIGNLYEYLKTVPHDYGDVEYKEGKVVSTIPINSDIYFLMAPTNEYVPVETLKLISKSTKI